MIIIKLCIIFAIVIGAVALKRSMTTAVLLGAVATALLYQLPLLDVADITLHAVTAWSTLNIVLIIYVITFLQRMMVQKNAIEQSRRAISAFFNNRWVNCAATPIFIGLLPSPNAAYIAGDMVRASADGYISDADQAVTTSFFRHVSEAFFPTYSTIILALSLSGYSASVFVIGMLPMVALLVVLGCFFLLRGKVPMSTGEPPSQNRRQDLKEIGIGLWPIILVIFLTVALSMDVLPAGLIAVALYFILRRFHIKEVLPYFKSAFEPKIILNTFAVMIFKDILAASGILDALPDFFSHLPIPTFLVFVLIFFFGTIVSGSLPIVATCLPVAMAAVPGAGLPLFILLMSISYAAMQISPTHICLSIVAEYFHVSFGDMVKGTLPLVLAVTLCAMAYYLISIAILAL